MRDHDEHGGVSRRRVLGCMTWAGTGVLWTISMVQGFNIRCWSERGLNYWAVSDLGADELTEFGEKFEATMRSSG